MTPTWGGHDCRTVWPGNGAVLGGLGQDVCGYCDHMVQICDIIITPLIGKDNRGSAQDNNNKTTQGNVS